MTDSDAALRMCEALVEQAVNLGLQAEALRREILMGRGQPEPGPMDVRSRVQGPEFYNQVAEPANDQRKGNKRG